MNTHVERKRDARSFLLQLQATLNDALPAPTEMRNEIRKKVAESKANDSGKHMRQPEDAFLYHYVVPKISSFLQSCLGLSKDEARHALLSEYYRNMGDLCSDTPARTQRHPFSKIIGAKTASIMRQWRSGRDNALTQSCPDFALREPFKIVFEGKYFERGGAERATTVLVSTVYQAFFYRALPYVAPRKPDEPAWDYEFSCLVAGDASEEGTLQRAWDALPEAVKAGFWEGANIFVMIVRGSGDRKKQRQAI